MQSIFGLHLEETVTITVEGSARYSEAPLFHGTTDGNELKWTEVEADDDTWEFALPAGDYIIRLEDDEAEGPITITASEPVALVTIPASGTPEPVVGELGKGVPVMTGNPKDPWPPPQSVIEIQGESLAWFAANLSQYYGLSRGADGADGGRPALAPASPPA